MKLICGGNPKELGIAKEDGNWDYIKFIEHVESCTQCKEYTRAIFEKIFEKTNYDVFRELKDKI